MPGADGRCSRPICSSVPIRARLMTGMGRNQTLAVAGKSALSYAGDSVFQAANAEPHFVPPSS
jgi:hypothetical protein